MGLPPKMMFGFCGVASSSGVKSAKAGLEGGCRETKRRIDNRGENVMSISLHSKDPSSAAPSAPSGLLATSMHIAMAGNHALSGALCGSATSSMKNSPSQRSNSKSSLVNIPGSNWRAPLPMVFTLWQFSLAAGLDLEPRPFPAHPVCALSECRFHLGL